MAKNKSGQNDNELKHHLLRRLVNVVVGNEENLAISAITFFVEQTLLESGNNKSQREIVQEIKRIFLLNFSAEEVGNTLKKLVEEKKVISSRDRYSLEISRVQELKNQNEKVCQFEKNIFNDWLNLVSIKYPNLTEDDKSRLVSDLQLYLNKIFLQHGAECATLIYPQEEKLNNLLKEYSTENLDKILPERGEQIKEIRRVEFPLFLRHIDNEKKIYFAGILDGTFVYNLVQVDPQTYQLIRDNFKNYRLFLDTNVLYSLFDLRDKDHTTKVEKAINLAKYFGIKIVVSQQTVEEMKKSINLKKEVLLSSPNIKRELAQIGADISEEENFITAYWRAYHKTGISKEDFIEKISHVSEILASKQIPIEEGINFTENVIENEAIILKSSLLPERKKSDNIARHDAYHRLLIKELRSKAERDQKPEKYWFLSVDSSLLLYDTKTRESGQTPFVLLPHQLLQILRPFSRKSEDYDTTFFELFSRPQIKSAQGVLPTDLTQKILAKMSGFSDLPPDIALGIIIDQSFRKKVLATTNDDNLDTIIKTETDNALITELKEYKQRLENLELENQKRSRLSEAENTDRQKKNKDNDKQLSFYKNLAFAISVVLFVVVNVIVFSYSWNISNKFTKGAILLIDFVSLALILRIKWRINKAVGIVLGLIGLLSFILQVVDR